MSKVDCHWRRHNLPEREDAFCWEISFFQLEATNDEYRLRQILAFDVRCQQPQSRRCTLYHKYHMESPLRWHRLDNRFPKHPTVYGGMCALGF